MNVEPPVATKPFLDAIVVEDGEGDRSFANATSTNKSDWIKFLGQTNDPLDQFVATETSPRWWGRWFSKKAKVERKLLSCLRTWLADLV